MTALTAEDFARIQATARRPWPWEDERQAMVRGTTDLAIVGLMRDGLLRVSEAADLTWKDLEEMGMARADSPFATPRPTRKAREPSPSYLDRQWGG